MSEVVADNHDATLATNNFAFIANLLHTWLNFHVLPSLFFTLRLFELLVPVNDSSSGEVIRTQFHDYTVGWKDTDVVLPHLPADVSENFMSVR
jgi:hypothetical protein